MLTFNGANFLGIHSWPAAEKPELHVQRNHFAGVWGTSQIVLGAGGRPITIPVWITDASLGSAQAVDQYRQSLDLTVGVTGILQISGAAPAAFADVTFEGFEPTGSVLPAIGAGLPIGTFWQPGVLHFFQLTVP